MLLFENVTCLNGLRADKMRALLTDARHMRSRSVITIMTVAVSDKLHHHQRRGRERRHRQPDAKATAYAEEGARRMFRPPLPARRLLTDEDLAVYHGWAAPHRGASTLSA